MRELKGKEFKIKQLARRRRKNFSNEGNASAVLSYFVEESNVDCAKLAVNLKTKQNKKKIILKAKNRLCKIRFRIKNNTLLIKVAEINASRNECQKFAYILWRALRYFYKGLVSLNSTNKLQTD